MGMEVLRSDKTSANYALPRFTPTLTAALVSPVSVTDDEVDEPPSEDVGDLDSDGLGAVCTGKAEEHDLINRVFAHPILRPLWQRFAREQVDDEVSSMASSLYTSVTRFPSPTASHSSSSAKASSTSSGCISPSKRMRCTVRRPLLRRPEFT